MKQLKFWQSNNMTAFKIILFSKKKQQQPLKHYASLTGRAHIINKQT
jgi:hypothetical protein